MTPDQLEILMLQIGSDLQELKKGLAITNKRLEEHIRQFDAHKEPITLPRWMVNTGRR